TVEGTAMSFTTTSAPVVIVAPEVVTLAASEITHESAVLNGTITAGSEEITAQGFMYKATAASDWTTVAATGANITATLTALTAETEYTFKAFATTASGTVEGEAMSFTTTAAPVVIVAPEVVTLAASEITNASATLNGTVTAGSEEITAQGFMYKATAAAEWTTVAATGENMTATVEGLEAEMAYEYKAFATTASGTVEGEVMSFTTLAGLNDAETINAMIYPNPADDKAIISVSVAGAKIVVSDMQGRILLSDDMTESTYELNTANMASSVYYIRIISGNAVSTQKLIVK
ncbi:MAG: T9SS type A sorting domain-containing protein, partial [Bacteroidales bacterium]|nr:T9SS type A sorting domain-containing protein [Bacteroidales bacterium]